MIKFHIIIYKEINFLAKMENFLENLNLIHFENFDYDYSVESLVIDINKLSYQRPFENELKNKKIEKAKIKIDNKKEAKSSNKQKAKKKKADDKDNDLNSSKQSSNNMSIFLVPNVKKTPNYDLQLSQMDKINKSKIKNVKKNDFDKIKKILSANNISMNLNQASRIIQEMKAKNIKNKQQQGKAEKEKEKQNENETLENQVKRANTANIFSSTVTNYIENEEIIDTSNPQDQIKNSEVTPNQEKIIKINEKENKDSQQQKLSEKVVKGKNKNKNKKNEKGNLEAEKDKEISNKHLVEKKQSAVSNTEKDKSTSQNMQSKRVDDFIKNLKEKKTAKAKVQEPEHKQFLKQSFYDKHKYMFIFDPTQRLKLRDINSNLNKEIILQFFETANSIFNYFDFSKEDVQEIEYIKQNVKDYIILTDNLMEICENKKDVGMIILIAESYFSHVKKIYESFPQILHINFILIKNLVFNCLYSLMKFFANILNDNNNLRQLCEDNNRKVLNNAENNLDSIFKYLNFFSNENEKNLNMHVNLLERNNILNNENTVENNSNNNEIIYLNSFTKKNVLEYNYKEDENLNSYLITKVCLFALIKNVIAIKKAFKSPNSNSTEINVNEKEDYGNFNLQNFISAKNPITYNNELSENKTDNAGLGKLINIFSNTVYNACLKKEASKDEAQLKKLDNYEVENSSIIDIESKRKVRKQKGSSNDSSNNMDYNKFTQFLFCLKFFTKLNLCFETQKNKIYNLMITVSKSISQILNEIKSIILNNFANEFYLIINKMVQMYIQNFKEVYEANESSYNEISDLINLVIDEGSQSNVISPFSINNKRFDFNNVNKKVFENFDFLNLEINYFLDDIVRNYLQITIKYLKISENGMKVFFSKGNQQSVLMQKLESNFEILTFLEFFNKVLICIINLKSTNLKALYLKLLSKPLESYITNNANNNLKTISNSSITTFESSNILIQYILNYLKNFIDNSFRNSTNKNILKCLKNVRETIQFYSNFHLIKKSAINLINDLCLFDQSRDFNTNPNKNKQNDIYLQNSICFLMFLNFFEFTNLQKNSKEENNDIKLFKEYIDDQRKTKNESYFENIKNIDRKLCLYYLNNYADSELKKLDSLIAIIYSAKTQELQSQYEQSLEKIKSISLRKLNLNIENESTFYRNLFYEIKNFNNILIKFNNSASFDETTMENGHNNQLNKLISKFKSFMYDLIYELLKIRTEIQKANNEKNYSNINILTEKAIFYQSLIVFFINKRDILLFDFIKNYNLDESETNLETCEFYNEILFIMTSDDNLNKSKEKKLTLKYDIMQEIKVNNEKLILKSLSLEKSNKQYPKIIKQKSDLFEYLIQIFKLDALLKESKQAEKIKEEIKLNYKKKKEEDILIESESNNINQNLEQINAIGEMDKINVIENLEKINNQVTNNNTIDSISNKQNENSKVTITKSKKSDETSIASLVNNEKSNENISEKENEEETIANLDLILKIFIEYFNVITDELSSGIESKFSSNTSGLGLENSVRDNKNNIFSNPLLEKTLFNFLNNLESITIILNNKTFSKSFVKNLALLEIFLRKLFKIKDLCILINNKLSNNLKAIQNSDTKIFEYNLDNILDSISLNELTEQIISLTSKSIKNKFDNYLIYMFDESELFKQIMEKDIESIQRVSFAMENFYGKSIFEQKKVNRYLKRIQDEDNDYLEDVMLEIYSKDSIKYLEYPEEVIDMLSTINEAAQNDFKISNKSFYNCIFPYFYLWKTIISKIEYGFKLFTADKKYVEELDNYKMLLKFNINYFERNTKLYNTFCLVVVSLLHILDEDRHLIEKKGNILNFENFDENELLKLEDKFDNRILFEFILNILYKFVKIFPSLVKFYYDQLQGKLKSVFRSLITNMILPKMLTHLKSKIDSNKVIIFY